MLDPQDTLNLLDQLQPLGFDDSAFALLHHFREGGQLHTIAQHRHYCQQRTGDFKTDSNNERIQAPDSELVLRA